VRVCSCAQRVNPYELSVNGRREQPIYGLTRGLINEPVEGTKASAMGLVSISGLAPPYVIPKRLRANPGIFRDGCLESVLKRTKQLD